ncbi:MAG: 4-alpha-glucanotransferase [Clostridiales bacterium]|nr:4-alpha-glucanotransferase [Clostridiales bacterium]
MRKAGVLLPISSLPSPWGIGALGAAAREFIDFLAAAGQSFWQILPLGPTSYGDSPYQSFSSWAGNPYFIDLDDLAAEGLLERQEYQRLNWGEDPARVDYGLLYKTRYPVLRKACARLLERGDARFHSFCLGEADWLEDYALFMALKERFDGRSWQEWPRPIRLREPAALEAARTQLAGEVNFWKGVQYLFCQQWKKLKSYANEKGVSILGDLPIYTALDSADVWASPKQFQLDDRGCPTEVAGCPPDAFSEDGQLWGNPLFDWERMKRDGYQWWLHRVGYQLCLYDALRIDHFRGFESYYAIPYGDTTARNGRWRPGPGLDFFQAVNSALGKQNIVAEDLGFLTPEVHRLLEDTGYPGMKVLEFAFGSRELGSAYLPHCYPTNCVVYTGTHDNDTIRGWMASAPRKEAAFAKEYLRLSRGEGYHWGMMRAAWASPAGLAVVQMQDLLGLGSEARMNIPSTLGGNWQWRALPGSYGPKLARRLHREMKVYQRLPSQNENGGPR